MAMLNNQMVTGFVLIQIHKIPVASLAVLHGPGLRQGVPCQAVLMPLSFAAQAGGSLTKRLGWKKM